MKHTRYVRPNAHGRWSVYEEGYEGGDVWLAEFESESLAHELAAAPELEAALERVIPWAEHAPRGKPMNNPTQIEATKQARAALAKLRERDA